jgi:ABC-type sugar transport system permease subunit
VGIPTRRSSNNWEELFMGQSTGRKPFPTQSFVFLAPAVIIYSLFMVYPLLNSLRLSLFAPNAENQEIFVGLSNYVKYSQTDFALLWVL